MVIAIDENIPLLAEALEHNENRRYEIMRFSGRSLTRDALKDCVALCVRSTTRVDEHLLTGTPVRFVGTATSGAEHIDEEYLRREGIVFRDAKGSNANSVAEYVMFAMLLWAEKQGFMRDKQALRGKTLGVVGYGHIGRRVAKSALRLGLRVIVSDPPFVASGGILPHTVDSKPLLELVRECDILTNHVPYTLGGKYETVGMFDNNVLNALQPEALFIHASRGGIVVESSLLAVIDKKNITAAVDVWHSEPSVYAPLAKQCLLATPHIAGYSFEGKINGTMMIAQALERFTADVLGKPLVIDWDKIAQALENSRNPFTPNVTDHSELLKALRESRQLEADTAQFLASLEERSPEAAFDFLRKTYPKRHEILH
ncbi:MAG: 4-phosphoerythronate dehydrogenase [Candidatus Kapabacteria bacterium]|nr:4-phosphoerythronate dehydrogenase [Candidatus Kapabacteria bacterium]